MRECETAWGKWIRKQRRGTLTRAMHETGLAWSTVTKAKKKRVRHNVAVLLSRFSQGAVTVKSIEAQPTSVGIEAAKKRRRSA